MSTEDDDKHVGVILTPPPERFFESDFHINVGAKITHHDCSYCGGFDVENAHGTGAPDNTTMLDIHFSIVAGELAPFDRKVCVKCYVKVFDTILGEPKKK